MKLLNFVTALLIPTIVTSTSCKNTELKCIKLCCKKLQVYNGTSKECEDIPEVAKASWLSVLYDTNPVSEKVEIVEYGKCNGNQNSTIPFCYSPFYDMVTNQTTLHQMSDVPCNILLKPEHSFWTIVFFGCIILVLPICLPIMTVYTCRKVGFIYKLLSWYLGSIAVVVLVMTAVMIHIPQIKLGDGDHIMPIYKSIILYIATSSLLWQNVIGFEIWSGFKAAHTRDDSVKDRKRFIYYSIYVWGLAAILTGIGYPFKGKTSFFLFNTNKFPVVPCFNMLTFVILSVNICVIRCGVVNLTTEVNFKFKLTLLVLRLALVMGVPRMAVLVLIQYASSYRFEVMFYLEPLLVFIVLVWKPKNCFNCNFGGCCCRKAEATSDMSQVVFTH